MKKWKAVRLKQELAEQVEKEVEKSGIGSLSEFISDAIRLRLETLAKEEPPEQRELLYTPRHVWVKPTPQGNVMLGVSDYWENELKGITYVGRFEEDDSVSKDEPFGTIETVAWWPIVIHDLVSPIDGKIVKVNKDVLDDPYILNGDPYQWIVEIQPSDPEPNKELEKLLSLQEYQELAKKLKGLFQTQSESFRWRIKQKAREERHAKEMENRTLRTGTRVRR